MTPAHALIKSHYGERTAERSKVPLINHIDEGLRVLEHLDASIFVMDAFCLHPIFQADDDLMKAQTRYLMDILEIDPYVMMLVMEYRSQANAWLSDKVHVEHLQCGQRIVTVGKPTSGPLPAVREMLIADKVQNYKDFVIHHSKTHERAEELEIYFKEWFKALGVTPELYAELVKAMEQA